MKKNKHYFVLWSGGLDSTALVHKLLKDGNKVTTGYVYIQNNRKQSERELKAIESISEYFSNRFHDNFKPLGKCSTIDAIQVSNRMLIYPTLWPFIINAIPEDCTDFVIGYVKNDDAISWLKDIERLYYAYKPFVNHLPKIGFPFIKKAKNELYDLLPLEIRGKISFCEDYLSDEPVCYSCNSCKKMLEYGIITDNRKDEPTGISLEKYKEPLAYPYSFGYTNYRKAKQ